jgi:predicted PurR-regulated permease PerM
VVVIIALALIFLLMLHSLALPLVFAAIVAVLAHPLQEKLVRNIGGRGWLVAAVLTLSFAVMVVCPPIQAVSVAYDDLQVLLNEVGHANAYGQQMSENCPQLRPAIEWVGRTTGVGEVRVRVRIRDGGVELEQALFHAR